MATYEADVTQQSGNIIDGDMRKIAKVVVTRYDTPRGKPVRVGTEIVRAWRRRDLQNAASAAAKDLMRRDKARRKREIERRIERLQAAGRVSLTKE